MQSRMMILRSQLPSCANTVFPVSLRLRADALLLCPKPNSCPRVRVPSRDPVFFVVIVADNKARGRMAQEEAGGK